MGRRGGLTGAETFPRHLLPKCRYRNTGACGNVPFRTNIYTGRYGCAAGYEGGYRNTNASYHGNVKAYFAIVNGNSNTGAAGAGMLYCNNYV
jgi:hypothetical protein